MTKFLTETQFNEQIKAIHGEYYWSTGTSRWDYHKDVLQVLERMDGRNLGIFNEPCNTLEIGTMGIQCVPGSQTMDIKNNIWTHENWDPTYIHDAKKVPWPFKDKQFEILIALRVWQHLFPHQKEAFLEADRIAKRLLLVVPEVYPNEHGVSFANLFEWKGSIPDMTYWNCFGKLTHLYYWGADEDYV